MSLTDESRTGPAPPVEQACHWWRDSLCTSGCVRLGRHASPERAALNEAAGSRFNRSCWRGPAGSPCSGSRQALLSAMGEQAEHAVDREADDDGQEDAPRESRDDDMCSTMRSLRCRSSVGKKRASRTSCCCTWRNPGPLNAGASPNSRSRTSLGGNQGASSATIAAGRWA
jgi:hypothetical protein